MEGKILKKFSDLSDFLGLKYKNIKKELNLSFILKKNISIKNKKF